MYRSWIEKQQQYEEFGLTATEATALQQYLDLKLNAHATAIQITTAFTAEGGNRLGILWGSLLECAQEFPEQQKALAELLLSMRQISDQAEHTAVSDEESKLKSSLKEFGWEIRDCWNYFDPPPSAPDRVNQRRLWINLNAFTARLAASPWPHLMNFGLWSLRDALEDDHEDKCVLDGYIPAAAQWIFHAGGLIHACEEEKAPHPLEGDPYKGGDLWTGKHGFCEERWQLWKQRFEWAAGSDLQHETKQIAREAVVAMSKIDDSSG